MEILRENCVRFSGQWDGGDTGAGNAMRERIGDMASGISGLETGMMLVLGWGLVLG